MFRQSYSGPNSGSLCPFGADSQTQLYLLLKLLDAVSDLPLSMDMQSSVQSLMFQGRTLRL